jgi:transposase
MDYASVLKLWFGIDISKKPFDVSWRNKKGVFVVRQFGNNSKGFARFLGMLKGLEFEGALCFCLESTGDYGTLLAMFLTEHGYHVSVVNPARVKSFGGQKGYLNKTDKADAKIICEFAPGRDASGLGVGESF